jgi:hypothetical protein
MRRLPPDWTNTLKQGELLADFESKGLLAKNRRYITEADKLMPLLTRDELERVSRWMTMSLLSDPETTAEKRREILAGMDECPCCLHWLGHNNPPADDVIDQPYRRQGSLKFD